MRREKEQNKALKRNLFNWGFPEDKIPAGIPHSHWWWWGEKDETEVA
jgi:hypothetical protein